MARLYIIIGLFLFNSSLWSQTYLGGGNSTNITATASSAYTDTIWDTAPHPINTVNGQGMMAPYFDAFRFLQQASIGFDEGHVQDVMNMGVEAWIDHQLTLPIDSVLPKTIEIWEYLNSLQPSNDQDRRPTWKHFNYAWWHMNTINADLLRHKVACALSEILVISRNSDLGSYGDGLADYYDMLLTHSFGNYRDLLYDVTTHACMGFYLSHLENPKTDTTIGQHPDENFAREIMQLFTIGLYELNNDGSHKMNNGASIPTYNNDDIKEYAKVFTGLGIGDVEPDLLDPNNMYDDTAYFGMGLWKANVRIPMRMYEWDDPWTTWRDEDQHEDGPKYLLNGTIVPGGQSGFDDINDAIDNLFNHANVGPFLAYRLIQRLVKSNPSPAYISRVADAFNGTGPYGNGRGNLASVIKAILMDVEARDVSYQMSDVHSKLVEPLFRYTHFSALCKKILLSLTR